MNGCEEADLIGLVFLSGYATASLLIQLIWNKISQ